MRRSPPSAYLARSERRSCLWPLARRCVHLRHIAGPRCSERGRFIWPSAADGTVVITPAQLGCLLEGIDWRMPQKPGVRARRDEQNRWHGGAI
ncbi:MAG: hypothetical protein EOQ99_28920 [Mesorhizobium sp.]|uniref:IS66 family insertion sequence element accessory protein TnpB n=1 Tax=Mesorhizobium muleiense TaxID=1004279 RepID=UPI000FE37661|nr:MAG: hypothetical protein EOQ33_04620 [Mesorhizobium sp.]RWB93847.1 MAG: hypothetical protein EOQ56_32765 [Mesorhizobium sp.]RWO99084.1 MAG: hypothetical protein EOQ99_28920 [Mesorhizobium sp.]RWP29792.1 MAG: hypothetical protein EOR02_15450 [Mesorhizobium sp.]RWP67929.1 MAG: hypothetical protein EOR07_09150 [Mesorhizobium sp.]